VRILLREGEDPSQKTQDL
jgi:hypothetical protein